MLVKSVLLFVVAAVLFVGLPAMFLWGWVRWARRAKAVRPLPLLSLTGFSLATVSGLVALAGIVYAHAIGGFPFWDPRLLRIYRWGFFLSLGGLVFALAGAWKPSSLRWHAGACSAGTIFFWFVAAMGE